MILDAYRNRRVKRSQRAAQRAACDINSVFCLLISSLAGETLGRKQTKHDQTYLPKPWWWLEARTVILNSKYDETEIQRPRGNQAPKKFHNYQISVVWWYHWFLHPGIMVSLPQTAPATTPLAFLTARQYWVKQTNKQINSRTRLPTRLLTYIDLHHITSHHLHCIPWQPITYM